MAEPLCSSRPPTPAPLREEQPARSTLKCNPRREACGSQADGMARNPSQSLSSQAASQVNSHRQYGAAARPPLRLQSRFKCLFMDRRVHTRTGWHEEMTVLIVEDNPGVRRLLRLALSGI